MSDSVECLTDVINTVQDTEDQDALIVIDPKMEEKIWDLYLRATNAIHGKEKIQSVCERYRLDLPHLRQSPLTHRMVDAIEVGAALLTIDDLRRKHIENGNSSYSFHSLKGSEVLNLVRQCNPIGYCGKMIPEITSAPSELMATIIYDRQLLDRELVQLRLFQ